MSTALARSASVPTAAMVAVDRIRFHPRNIRRELGDLRDLTASIEAEGVLQPLLLHRTDFGLQVVDGHRRLAAAKLAGLHRVPALIVDELDDDEAIAKMLATTLKRGIDHGERRAAVQVLVEEFGHTRSGLARRLGVTPGAVSQWLADEQRQQRICSVKSAAAKRRVGATRITALADSWQDRAANGLTATEAAELLAELRALAPSSPVEGATTEAGQ